MVLGAALAACGGGGSGPPPSQVDVAAALRALHSGPHSWTVTAVVGVNQYKVVFDLEPLGASTFPVTGAASVVSRQTVAYSIDAGSDLAVADLHFDPDTLALLGWVAGTSCAVTTARGTLPSAATSGDAGLLYLLDEFDGCTATASKVGSTEMRWSLERDRGVLLFCRNATHFNAAHVQLDTEDDCASVSGNGALGNQARIRLSTADLAPVTLRNY